MKNISILWAIHEDFWPLALFDTSAVPPLRLLTVAHCSPLTACIPHGFVFLQAVTRSLQVELIQLCKESRKVRRDYITPYRFIYNC